MPKDIQFSEAPDKISVQKIGDSCTVTLTENARSVETEDGVEWYADLYFLNLPATDNLTERIEKNFDKFLAKAKSLEQSKLYISEPVTNTDLMEILADQEYRLCLIELGIGGDY